MVPVDLYQLIKNDDVYRSYHCCSSIPGTRYVFAKSRNCTTMLAFRRFYCSKVKSFRGALRTAILVSNLQGCGICRKQQLKKKRQWPKTGAPGRSLARSGWAEVRRQQTLNLGSRDWPTPPSTRFWSYTDRDLPILATLVSSHPVLATF